MAPVCLWRPLTHNESLCVRELLEEFPKVFIALLVCRAQHLQWQTESATSTHTHMHAQSHTYTHMCFQSSHASCSLPHSHTTVLPVTQRRLFVSMWDNLVKTSHRVDDFHSVGNFDKHWTWTYSEWQAEVCGLSYLQSLMRLHSRQRFEAQFQRHQPAADHSIHMLLWLRAFIIRVTFSDLHYRAACIWQWGFCLETRGRTTDEISSINKTAQLFE